MTEEEKEAIKIMLEDTFFWQGKSSFITRHRYKELSKKMYEEIDKLQKENEQLKEENLDQVYMKAIADYKEKIRKIKKRLENGDTRCYPGADGTEFAIRIIDELLEEENERRRKESNKFFTKCMCR